MVTSSRTTQPHVVLPTTSTHPTQPSVLSSSPIVSPQRRRKGISKERVVSIDLRIGLNLLGEQGRKLLAEYITIKRQRLTDKSS